MVAITGIALVGGGIAVVVWAPPERANLLMTMAGVVIAGISVWQGTRRRR